VIAFLPFALQGLVMGVDEFYCHRRRGLGRWERIGHPVDTLFFLFCLIYLLVAVPSPFATGVYAVMAVISCLLITKDEWQHVQRSDGFENWLHSLLFMLHPVLLIWAGWLWWHFESRLILGAAAFLSAGFLIYQSLYWNLWRRDQ
jgi:hypothetical protein